MTRKGAILLLTHFYPLFVSGHLVFGDWCKKCQLMFNIVPIFVFGGLFAIWHETSHIKLDKTERMYIRYFLINLVFIYCYYCLCIISMPTWVYSKNTMVSGVLLITLSFYIFNYRGRK